MVKLKKNGQLIEINGDGYPSDRLRYRRTGDKLSIVYMEDTVVVPLVAYDEFVLEDTPAASVSALLAWIGENFKGASGSAGSSEWTAVAASTEYILRNADHKKGITMSEGGAVTASAGLDVGMEVIINNASGSKYINFLGDYAWVSNGNVFLKINPNKSIRAIVVSSNKILVSQ